METTNHASAIDLSGRKCPVHNAYIQSYRPRTGDRTRQRYCPVCLTIKLKQDAIDNKDKPKLRIGKI